MLEGLTPAVKVEAPKGWRPAVTFDGSTGEAITPGVSGKPDFTQYLIDAGYDPNDIEVVGNSIRTSRWQRYDGEWLTSYRFTFTTKSLVTDLPLLWATAKRSNKASKTLQFTDTGKAFIVALADFQIGKTDHRGGTQELLERIFASYDRIEEKFRKGKYEKIILVDVGDIVEGFSNKADMQQAVTNNLSLMQQVDMGVSLIWEICKRAAKFAPVEYVSVASNHCQFRLNKQQVGLPGRDDWGVMIAQQIHRLSTETGILVKVSIPDPHDESLALDVFGDGFHILGVWHGHQSGRPEGVPDWWRKQAFGGQPVSAATIGLTGHFHHLRVQELGNDRYWIQSPTMDAGSNWFRLNQGEDSATGIVCFEVEKNKKFTGTVWKL